MIKEINSYVTTPYALVIQYDGFILNPDAWYDEYLGYDYIGSPWLRQNPGEPIDNTLDSDTLALKAKLEL